MSADKAFLKRMQLMGKIGNWTNTGAGHVRGYPGLAHTALMITEYIPKAKIYCEPFAGLGRTAKHVKANLLVLNDKSDYAYSFLKAHFVGLITQLDFEDMFRYYDGPDNVFLIDPPWSKSEYEKGCKNRAFCDRTPRQYYDKIFEWLPKLESTWFVCGEKNNSLLKNSSYHKRLFTSKKKIMGGNISTLVISNRPFKRYHQKELIENA